MAGSADALERFQRQTAVPMLILAVASLPLIVVPFLLDLSPTANSTLFAIDWFIWAAFALEYGVRLYLAPEKWIFIKANVIDVIVVALPFLRPLRVVRSAKVLRVLRLGRATAIVARAVDALRDVLARHRFNYTLLVAMIATIGGAFMVLELERSAPGANILTLPDALWWAITTVTTVGYGDKFPTTGAGRAIAAVLMVLGIALFGFIAASVSAMFVRKDVSKDVNPQFDEINARLERIELAIERLGHQAPAHASPSSIRGSSSGVANRRSPPIPAAQSPIRLGSLRP
jgi:voltage-gated potassium channel